MSRPTLRPPRSVSPRRPQPCEKHTGSILHCSIPYSYQPRSVPIIRPAAAAALLFFSPPALHQESCKQKTVGNRRIRSHYRPVVNLRDVGHRSSGLGGSMMGYTVPSLRHANGWSPQFPSQFFDPQASPEFLLRFSPQFSGNTLFRFNFWGQRLSQIMDAVVIAPTLGNNDCRVFIFGKRLLSVCTQFLLRAYFGSNSCLGSRRQLLPQNITPPLYLAAFPRVLFFY